MSYVTRCPQCGTAFRVVPDQLKISEGWVRCGHCQTVFDATLDLQLWHGDPPAAVPTPPPMPDALSEPLEARANRPDHGGAPDGAWDSAQPPPVDTTTPDSAYAQEVDEQAPPHRHSQPSDAEQGGAVEPRRDPPPEQGSESVPEPEPELLPPSRSEPDAAALTEPAAEPGFVRQARRRAFWRRPLVRGGLLLASALSLGALAGQWALHHRDQIVATRPDWRPVFESACAVLGCELKPWRDVRALQLEDTALRRLGPGHYALELVLWNQGLAEVATPALELGLTDRADQVWLRKVFGPADLADLPPTIAAQGRLPVRLELVLEGGPSADAAVAGYRVLFFYP